MKASLIALSLLCAVLIFALYQESHKVPAMRSARVTVLAGTNAFHIEVPQGKIAVITPKNPEILWGFTNIAVVNQ